MPLTHIEHFLVAADELNYAVAGSGGHLEKGEPMNGFRIAAFLSAFLLAGAAAQSPAPSRVRGTITAVDGNTLSVKSREGQDLKIELAPNATFAYMKRVNPADIRLGTLLGTTAVKGADGKLVARELRIFNPDRPIPSEGHRPWDLEPESTMTNAMVTAMVQANRGSELTLTYKGGEQQVFVPAGVPIVMAVETDRSVIVAGEYAYIAVTAGADGKLTATRLQVTKDGVRPPQ
jgi:hypothetical protein